MSPLSSLQIRLEQAERERDGARAVLASVTAALVWASGSPDFRSGGQAEAEWRSVAQPEIDRANALLAGKEPDHV